MHCMHFMLPFTCCHAPPLLPPRAALLTEENALLYLYQSDSLFPVLLPSVFLLISGYLCFFCCNLYGLSRHAVYAGCMYRCVRLQKRIVRTSSLSGISTVSYLV